MSDRDHRSDWTLILAIALIVVGAWLLAGQVLGDWWSPMRRIVEFAGRIAWPVMIIMLGLLILWAGRRGNVLQAQTAGKRLYRSRSERMVSGVIGGLADYLGVDPTLLRIVYAVVALVTGFGPALLLYIVATVIVPEEPLVAPVPPAPPVPPAGS